MKEREPLKFGECDDPQCPCPAPKTGRVMDYLDALPCHACDHPQGQHKRARYDRSCTVPECPCEEFLD